MSSDMRLFKKVIKIYSYHCERCFYNCDNELRMASHCLNVHGVSGKFGKGYKIKIKGFIKG
jgi:hypothetical protein